jgi:hypothetical protein
MAAFYSATAHMVSCLGSLPHASEWVAGQNLADPNSFALQTLKQLHDNLLTHYNCTEWAPSLADDAPAPDAPAQGRDDDSARPLSLPPLNLLASLRVRQDEDNGEVAARPSLPPQRQVTKHIMQTWTLPPTDRMRDVHMLHHTQSVPMLDETSALRGNMPQRNDEEGGKQPRLFFSPAASVWGQMGRAWTTGGRNAPRTTESITEKDYVAFFHQFFGLTNDPALAPFANVPCRCQRYFMGGEGAWDHINSCLHHASNWTCAHDHVLRALERICNDAGFATTHKRVLTSEGNLRADLEIRNIRVAQQTDLLVDVTVRHDFIGAGHIGQNQASSATPTTRIASSRAPLPTRSATIVTHIAATGAVPARGFLAGVHVYLGPHPREPLRLIFFLYNKQADDYFGVLGYQLHKQEFFHRPRRFLPAKLGHHRDGMWLSCWRACLCHRRGVFFQQNRGTIGLACAQAAALRGAPTAAHRHVAAPRDPPPLHMA